MVKRELDKLWIAFFLIFVRNERDSWKRNIVSEVDFASVSDKDLE